MAITYSWEFPQLDIAPKEGTLSKVVKTVHWRLNAAEGDHSIGAYGTVELNDAAKADFVGFDSLSPATIQGWVEEILGDQTQVLKDGLANNIAKQKSPNKVPAAPPWA